MEVVSSVIFDHRQKPTRSMKEIVREHPTPHHHHYHPLLPSLFQQQAPPSRLLPLGLHVGGERREGGGREGGGFSLSPQPVPHLSIYPSGSYRLVFVRRLSSSLSLRAADRGCLRGAPRRAGVVLSLL